MRWMSCFAPAGKGACFVEDLPVRFGGAWIAKIGVLLGFGIGQQQVRPKRFFVEENAGAHAERRIKLAVPHSRVGRHVDAQIVDDAFRDGAIGTRALDRVGAAVAQQLAAVDVELIAFGVAAEVV